MRWTTGQEEVLREHGHEGVLAVQRALIRECGAERSVGAIQAHASRIRVSLRVLEVCPCCGAAGARLNRQSGMCPRCTLEAHVAEERAFSELLALEAAGCEEGPELEAARREYARLRQANSRTRRRHGLAGKAERGPDGAPKG